MLHWLRDNVVDKGVGTVGITEAVGYTDGNFWTNTMTFNNKDDMLVFALVFGGHITQSIPEYTIGEVVDIFTEL